MEERHREGEAVEVDLSAVTADDLTRSVLIGGESVQHRHAVFPLKYR